MNSSFSSIGMSQSKPCKYILNKESCPFGEKCRFLHQHREAADHVHDEQRDHARQSKQSDSEKYYGDRDLTEGHSRAEVLSDRPRKNQGRRNDFSGDYTKKNTTVCHFYLRNSRCKYGDKCKFVHSGRSVRPVFDEHDHGNDLKDSKDHKSKKSSVCHFYLKNSWCKFGDNCKFIHSGSEEAKEEEKSLPKDVHVKRASSDSDKGCQYSDTHNPPPLTLASFMTARTHVRRPHKASQGQKEVDSGSLRDVRIVYHQ